MMNKDPLSSEEDAFFRRILPHINRNRSDYMPHRLKRPVSPKKDQPLHVKYIPYKPREDDDMLPKVTPHRIQKHVLTVRDQVLETASETHRKLEELPPHRLPDLKEMVEGKEKERILKSVYKLMQENRFENVPPEKRAWKGCIFHAPQNMETLRKRVANSKIFLVIIRKSDRKIMGFTEFTGNRILKLFKRGKIRHPHLKRIEVVVKYSEQGKVFHEQLIVVDQTLNIKGIGTALLTEAFNRVEKMGAVIVTTEVQGIPPNNKSMHFHGKKMKYCEIGTVKEHPKGSDAVNFVLYARALPGKVIPELQRSIN